MKRTQKNKGSFYWKWGPIPLVQNWLLLIFMMMTIAGLSAQNQAFIPATGSGSASYPIIETAIQVGLYQGPDITDPCSCTDVAANCFADEFVILSPTQDTWVYRDDELDNIGYGIPSDLDGNPITDGTIIPETGRIFTSSGAVQYYIYSLKVLVCNAAPDHLYTPLAPVNLPTANTATGTAIGTITPTFTTTNDCGRSYGARVEAMAGGQVGEILFTGSLCHQEKEPSIGIDVHNTVSADASHTIAGTPTTAAYPPYTALPTTVTIDANGNLDFDLSPNTTNGINNGTWDILLNGTIVASGTFNTLGPHPQVENIDLMALSNAACGLLEADQQNLVLRYNAGDTRPFKFENYNATEGVQAADFTTDAAIEALERSILNPGCLVMEYPVALDIQWFPNNTALVIPDLGDITNGIIDDPITSNTQYPDDQTQRFTVCPDDPNTEVIRMIFPTPDFDISQGDVLTIYDGTDCSSVRWTNNGALIAGVNGLPNGGWIDATCSNASGCLTFEFIPDSGQDKGSYRFTWESQPRNATVTCPTNTTLPSICDLNESGLIAALYAIPSPTATCGFVPVTSGLSIMNTTTSTAMAVTPDRKTTLTALVDEGDYFDSNDNMAYDLGETIFLQMGEYTISYDYTAIDGTTTTNCSHTATVSEVPPVCNNQVNISLNGSTCSMRLAPDMLIEGDGCASNYTINVLDGPTQGTDTINYASLGQLIRVEAIAESGNSCWGYVLVEDKAAPTFTCPAQNLYCGISTNPADTPSLLPQDGEDCSLPITYSFTDQETSFGCTRLGSSFDPDTVGRIVRTWFATDSLGNQSSGCMQTISLLKPKLSFSNVIWPADTTLYCNITNDPSPENTGYPSVQLNDTIIPLSSTCYFGIDYDDIVFDTDCEGVQKIERTWRILDWCSVGTGSTVLIDLDPQIIKVADTIAPVILNFPTSLQHQSDHGACAATVVLPAIQVADECSPNSATYRIIGPSSTLFGQGGVMENVPFGTNEFTYIAEDGCGNQRQQSITLTIEDTTPPTAIAGQISVSLIDATEITWVYASAFDGGSHDNCRVVSVRARKVGEVDFEEALGFTCSDIGTQMVEIEVTDEQGNVGLAMNEITVTDKLGVCDCNMTTNLTITETSGATQNDGKLCEGDMATLTASANTPVTYAWSTGETTAAIQVSTAAIYTVTITDATNCSVVETATIEVNPAVTSSLIATENSGTLNDDMICSSASVDLTFSVSGGTLPYTYEWSGLTGLTAGNSMTVSPANTTTYSITTTDAEGCSSVASRTITVNDLAGTLTGEDAICNGNSATLALAVTGGITPYTYTRSDASLTLEAGGTQSVSPTTSTTYTIIITDAAGCSINLSKTINVTTITPNLVADDALICVGASTDLVAAPTGGTTPYTYSWEEVGGAVISTTPSTISVSPTDTTTYQVQITDDTGCTATQTITINVPTPSVTIDILEASSTTNIEDGTICSGETAELLATSSSAVSYAWSTSETTQSITVSTANVYSVTITDANGCTASNSQTITVSQPDATVSIVETSGATDNDGIICLDDQVVLSVPSVTGATYLWTNEAGTTISTTNSATDNPGSSADDLYAVTVTDTEGCTATTNTMINFHLFDVDIRPDNVFRVNVATDIEAVIVGGETGDTYEYAWSVSPTGNGTFSSTNTAQTTYTPTNNTVVALTVVATSQTTSCVRNNTNTVTPTAISMAALSGKILTEQGEEVEQTTISLSGYEMTPVTTGTTGSYEFTPIPINGNYTVTPEKNRNPLNGVSTFDLILMSKHILGIDLLDSPYKMIAADVNHSGSITAYDMVQLRKLILNIDTEFPNNTSWRFIDAAYEFTDPTNPFREAFPETYEITDLDTDMTWLDFIAVKIGDLNNSATPNRFTSTTSRSTTGTLFFETQQELQEEGTTLIYHFSTDDLSSILGYQFTLEFDPTVLAFDRVIETDWIGTENFGLMEAERGILTSSWHIAEAIAPKEDKAFFSLAFKVRGKAMQAELLQLSSNKLPAEAYQASGELLKVELQQEAVVPEVATDQLELYQNRPNPFTGKTTIGFYLPKATMVTMRIFNTEGSIIKVYQGDYQAGYNELIIDSKDLTHYGALYYQLATPTQIATRKMIYTK